MADARLLEHIALKHWVSGLSYDFLPQTTDNTVSTENQDDNEEQHVILICEKDIEHIMNRTGVDMYQASKALYFCEGCVVSAITWIHREKLSLSTEHIHFLSESTGVDKELAREYLRESMGHIPIALTALFMHIQGDDQNNMTSLSPSSPLLFTTQDIAYVMEEADVCRDVARAALLHCEGDGVAVLLQLTRW